MASRNIFGYIILIIFPVFEISCTVILSKAKSNLHFRKRGVKLIQVCSIASWMSYINLVASLFDGMYCGLYHLFFILLPPLSIGPQLIRAITLWGMLEHNKHMLEYGQITYLRKTSVIPGGGGGSKRECVDPQPVMTPILEGSSSKDEELADNSQSELFEDKIAARQRAIKVKKKMKRMVRLTKTVLLIQSLSLVLSLLLSSSPDMLLEQDFSKCFDEQIIFMSIGKGFAITYAITAFITTILVRKCKDALGLRGEITRNVSLLFLTNTLATVFGSINYNHAWQTNVYAVQQMLLSFSMIIIPYYFPTLPSLLLDRIKLKSFLALVLPSSSKSMPSMSGNNRTSMILQVNPSQGTVSDAERDREVKMSLDAGLCVLLSTSEGIEAFTEHCSREFSVENIRFWCAVNEFHNAVDLLRTPACQDESDYGENDLRVFANDIVDTYIKNDSEMQINISASQRNKVQKDVINTGGPIKRGVFDNAQKEVYAMMSRHSYPRFLVTQHKDVSHCSSSGKRSSTVMPT